jgi:alkylation response protein AidB-like acyl-CoA dehydrogenase
MKTQQRGGSYLYAAVSSSEVFLPEDRRPEHREIARIAREFVGREVMPRRDALERHDWSVARQLIAETGDLGFNGVEVPVEYGGLGLDKITSTVIADEMGPTGSFAVTFMVQTGIGMLPILYFGTSEQKRRYLPALTSGQKIAAYALTESTSGSDALSARCSARQSEDGTYFILNGSKQWTSNAGFADVFVVFAKVGGDKFTAFIVECGYPGVTIGAEERKMGLKGSSTASVSFSNVQVPAENVLHEVGKGHQVAFNMLNVGRFKLGAMCLGASRHLLNVTTKYAGEREQFGRPIASFGLVRQKLAAMAVKIYAMEAAIYRIGGLLDAALEGLDLLGSSGGAAIPILSEYAVECSIAKVFASEALSDIADQGVQIHGGYGFMQGYDVERAYRDNRVNRIFEGTNEINRLLIAQTLFRRVRRGELSPVDLPTAIVAIEKTDVPIADPSLGPERAVVEAARQLFWVVAGIADRRYPDGLDDAQEILAIAADIAIGVFTMESTVVRATRAIAASDSSQSLQVDLAKAHVQEASAALSLSLRAAIRHLAAEADRAALLALVDRMCSPIDSIEIGRRIADAVVEAEGWPLD